ncbi:MAG: sigma-70 family RNA polymerase sigma factor, partial [Candidatus Hydrogenedentes bacterium]|nr:sigma-70 family RNA polymerase sigma factor [Candidatus Hydrogenedentota bacterium]
MNSPGDELLQSWCLQRDPEAFRAIVGRHAGMVYATCRRVLRDAAEAEDVTQECFEALVTARRPPYHYLGPWLHRVAANLSLKRLRASGRRKIREQQYADAQAAHVEPTWDDIYQCVDEIIATLPEKLRVPVTSHFLQGMTHEAIASQMGIAPPTVRYRIAKGLERIAADFRKRQITASAGTLAALFASHFAEAAEVPSALTASLGKLALAQSAKGSAGIAGGWLTQQFLAKVLVAAVIPLITVVSTVLLVNREDVSDDTVIADLAAASEQVIAAQETSQRSEPAGPRTGSPDSAAPGALPPLSQGVPAEFLYLFEPIEKGPGAVYGNITDPNGEPVAGARITLFCRDSWWKHGYAETVTNAHGAYEITDLPVSRLYQLTAVSAAGAASGHVALYLFSDLADRLAQFGSAPVFPDGSQPGPSAGLRCRRNLSIRPIAAPSMTGQVLDADGVPVEGAVVATAGNPFLAVGLSPNVRTDSDGRFAVHNLLTPEGKSSLVAYAKGYAPTMIHDVPAESSSNDIVLEPAHRVSGVARLKETGQPVTGKQVTLQTVSDLDPRNVAVTDQDGAFRFEGLAAKLYVISLTDTETGLVSIEAHKLDLRKTGSIDDIELLVSPGASISGRVYVEETDEPIAGVHVRINHTRTSDSVREAVTGPDGTYHLQSLSAGKY